ncbi:hypothetical protein GCM10009847_23510 [Leucobacter tardus]
MQIDQTRQRDEPVGLDDPLALTRIESRAGCAALGDHAALDAEIDNGSGRHDGADPLRPALREVAREARTPDQQTRDWSVHAVPPRSPDSSR